MQQQSEEDFERPNDPMWAHFEQAVRFVFDTWDILERVQDDEGAGEDTDYMVSRVVDDTLANYAERWIVRRDTRPETVAEFFVETFEEFFSFDVDFQHAMGMAITLTTLYNECRNGDLTGVNYFASKRRTAEAMDVEAPASAESQEPPKPDKPPKNEPDEDGWTTVPSGRKKR